MILSDETSFVAEFRRGVSSRFVAEFRRVSSRGFVAGSAAGAGTIARRRRRSLVSCASSSQSVAIGAIQARTGVLVVARATRAGVRSALVFRGPTARGNPWRSADQIRFFRPRRAYAPTKQTTPDGAGAGALIPPPGVGQIRHKRPRRPSRPGALTTPEPLNEAKPSRRRPPRTGISVTRSRAGRRRGEASPHTLAQIRTAAYRKWGPRSTPEAIAGVLEVRTVWVQEAIAGDFKRVCELYGVGVNAGVIADDLELPEHFVAYCYRRINAAAAAARARRVAR